MRAANFVAQHIAQMEGRVIVAIDGVDGAGKTTFADQLKPLIEAHGKPVLRVSIDAFHNPRAQRYQKGTDSPEGYFLDSFNVLDLVSCVVNPFRAEATRLQITQFDYRIDQPQPSYADVPAGAALLIDGVYLHRDELFALWDYSVFLDVPFAETFRRMSERDGFDPDPLASSNRRYFQGQLIYLERCNPLTRANLVVEGP